LTQLNSDVIRAFKKVYSLDAESVLSELGIELTMASTGAHGNNMLFGRRQKTAAYDFGPGTYNSPGVFDSAADQQALIRGYMSGPKYPELKRKELHSYPKYNPK
jgi:hypothetical protein